MNAKNWIILVVVMTFFFMALGTALNSGGQETIAVIGEENEEDSQTGFYITPHHG